MKSFSKAADKLYISQPALSASIKKFEKELGLAIFDRSCKPIELTDFGEYYIKSIEEVMTIENNLKSFIRENTKEVLRIGASSYFCAYVLPSYINKYKKLYPDINIQLLELNINDMLNCIDSNIVDICVGVDELKSNDVTKKCWYTEEILIAVPASFEVNKYLKSFQIKFSHLHTEHFEKTYTNLVSLNHFKSEPFVFLKKGNDMYERANQMCNDAGFSPNVSLYVDQLLSSYHIAYNGQAIAFVRQSIINMVEPTKRVIFYRIDHSSTYRDIYLQYSESRTTSDFLKNFIDFLVNS